MSKPKSTRCPVPLRLASSALNDLRSHRSRRIGRISAIRFDGAVPLGSPAESTVCLTAHDRPSRLRTDGTPAGLPKYRQEARNRCRSSCAMLRGRFDRARVRDNERRSPPLFVERQLILLTRLKFFERPAPRCRPRGRSASGASMNTTASQISSQPLSNRTGASSRITSTSRAARASRSTRAQGRPGSRGGRFARDPCDCVDARKSARRPPAPRTFRSTSLSAP